ncbi:hypothetical protein AALP_AAs64007U000400 [Arabis alpina]|uniref:ADP-ribosyl cyclase/cyclic ADP-ribose hydrolase n=1 Tax=Arabis alpina TaxID=50452 RepID=A0A087FXW6_ARAAL|nr:hypothetical protein AALP_AAs64007U000400 [Arabis alpina]
MDLCFWNRILDDFGGQDVRRAFLSHILMEFEIKGITLFIDNEIKRGESIAPELKRAIRESRVAIVMLSRKYASSTWCLDELVEIMECRKELGQLVVPVFYEVDPSNVRKQTGDFGERFRRTCEGKTKGETERWRQALRDVANILGYHSRDWTNEAALIESIAIDISQKLINSTPSCDGDEADMFAEITSGISVTSNDSESSSDSDNPDGMDAHMEKMKELLCLESDEVRMIGISGPRGIGKTTIANNTYDQFSHQFHFSTILANINEYYASNCRSEEDAKLQLTRQLLFQLSNQNDDTDEIFHLGVAQETLKDKKVLVVVDDVDGLRQLDALEKEIRCFGPGSRIIVITKDQRLLKAYGIDHIYNVDYPLPDEALQIFCMYAFGQKAPYDGFADLAQEITTLSGKLPLGLRLMGTYLQYMSKQEWTDQLPRLRTSLDGEIESVLKFSYESLCGEDKESFQQHIACSSYDDSSEMVEEFFAKTFSDVRQELIISNHDLTEDLFTRERAFEEISNGFLRWEYSPLTCWPSMLHPEFLVELYMPKSKLEKLWEGVRSLENLRLVDFSSSKNLKELPNLSTATNLKILNLRCCTSLVELPSSIGNATNLHNLHLEYCASLVKLPSSIGKAINLTELYLTGCSSLVELPASIVNANNLQKLHLGYCTSLVKLPSLIGNARNLKELCLSGCSSLVELPAYFVKATSTLQKLNLEYCSSLVKLPSSIGNAINLKELYLIGCSSLVELPASLGKATNLEILDLSNCSSLVELPSSIENLSRIHYLDLSNCSCLVELPSSIWNATNLGELILKNCSSLVELPYSIGNATRLWKLDLSNCSSLVELPSSIGKATSLEYLYLSNCSSLVELPYSIGHATSLRYLYLNNCSNLIEVPSSLGYATNLKKLDLSWCTNLVEVPASIRNSTSLWQLDLDNCSSLLNVSSSIGNGVHLKKLDLSLCTDHHAPVVM